MLIYDIVPPSKIIQQNQRKKKIRVLDILKPTLSLWLVVLLILQILAGVLFLPPIQEAMAADWYNSDWGYRREITVTTDESVGTSADYQVLVTLTTADMDDPYTNVNADGSDIFFTNTNGTSPIAYWIESWDNEGDSEIWVEVPDAIDANSSKTIYMYYGYSEASSASNGTNTFEFFDDFEDIEEVAVAVAFGQINSVEYGNHDVSQCQEAVADFNAWNPDFVISLGDIINRYESNHDQSLADLDVIEAVYDDLTMNRYYALGNHELDYISKSEFFAHTGMNEKYYSFDVGNFHFIVLDPCFRSDDDSDDYDSGNFDWGVGYVPPGERTWLTNDLSATSKKTIVFCEYNLDGGDYGIINHAAVRSIFEASGKVLYVFGAHSGTNGKTTINGIEYYRLRSSSESPTNAYAKIRIYTDNSIYIEGIGEQTTWGSPPVTSLDWDKWEQMIGTQGDGVSVANSIFTFTGASGIYREVLAKSSYYSSPVVFEFYAKKAEAGDAESIGISNYENFEVGTIDLGGWYANPSRSYRTYNDGYAASGVDSRISDLSDTYHKLKIEYISSTSIKYYEDGVFKLERTETDDVPDEDMGFAVITLSASSITYLDYVFVRKYASPEPTTSVGGETALPSIQFTSTSSSGAESSTPAQLELTLSAVFGENVTVDYAVTNGTATGSGTDYTLASGTATITAGNTTTAIDATFDIIDDSIDESDETIEVTISNPVNASLGTNTVHTYTITDNDTAGVTVTESADSTDITEAGSTDTYDVVLTSEPTSDVVITISPDSQTTTNPTSLTFTSANWDTAQTVTVTAIDDDVAEGNHTSTITHSSASDDVDYNGISISSVTANITDNDTAGITVDPTSGLVTTEAGGTDTFTVVLTSEPTADVSISLSSSDTSEGTVSPSSLTFTSANWSTQQTVTVTGVNDNVDDGDIGYTIVTAAASSSDANYNNLDPDDVALTNSDDDEPASSGGGGLPSGAYNPPASPSPSSQNPQGEFKVLINNDEEYTNDRIVTLSLNGGPDAKRMAISENADFYGAGQEAYQTTRTWTLTENEEEKTIYVKFYTQYGQASQIVSDTIIYQPSFAKAMEGEEEKEELEEPEPFEPEQPEEQQPEPEEPEQEIEEPEEEVFPPLEEELSPLEYLPKAIKEIAWKFSPIKDTFVKLKIKTQQDLERLKNIKLTIPNLKELIGLKKPELKSEITFREPVKPEIKELIPEDTLFFTACEDKIHLNTELTSLDKEEPEQEVKLISGHIIKVILKPSHSVKNVKAQFVLKEREEASYNSQNSFSDLFLSPVLAKEFENRFVLAEFELTDPDGDGIYTAEVQAPLVAGEYEIITILDYEDEEIQDKELRVITLVDPEGYVWTSLPQGETRIKDANVFLYWFNPEINKYQLWPADEYQQINPQITRETGEYSFLVPEGTYYLKVEADTYLDSQTEPFEVREGEGIHKNIELEKGFWQGMDWKTISLVIILILVFILLLYNFYRDRKFRKKLLA